MCQGHFPCWNAKWKFELWITLNLRMRLKIWLLFWHGAQAQYKCIKTKCSFGPEKTASIGMDITSDQVVYRSTSSNINIVDPVTVAEDNYPFLFAAAAWTNYNWRTASECMSNCLDFPGCHAFTYTKENRGFCRLFVGTSINTDGVAPNGQFWEDALGFRPSETEIKSYNEGLITGNLHANQPCASDYQFLSEYEIKFKNEYRMGYPKHLIPNFIFNFYKFKISLSVRNSIFRKIQN